MTITSESPHSRRQRILDAMAMLCGFTLETIPSLPDGTRPDVLRLHPCHGGAFLGDAKDTETPGNQETQVRLAQYAGWASSIQRSGKPVVVALCVPPRRGACPGWLKLLVELSHECDLVWTESGIRRISHDCAVVWVSG